MKILIFSVFMLFQFAFQHTYAELSSSRLEKSTSTTGIELLNFASQKVQTSISFKDVSLQARIIYSGPSFGASWGDYNDNKKPDLRVVGRGF